MSALASRRPPGSPQLYRYPHIEHQAVYRIRLDGESEGAYHRLEMVQPIRRRIASQPPAMSRSGLRFIGF